jgi:DNA (cytosine-5)-methyltransferase 1
MKSLEIFSGAGGMAKGLSAAGILHSNLVELNKTACATLRANFDPLTIFEGDIADFALDHMDNVDIVAGGPPCQPFSLGGKHQSHQDKRDMFPCAISCIEHLRPRAFIFENVKGLLRKPFSQYFNYIILRLTHPRCRISVGEGWEDHLERLAKMESSTHLTPRYNVSYKLLNAADYGVPQQRERVFIIGLRSDLELDWEFPSATHSEDRLNWDKFVTGEYWKRHNLPAQANLQISAALKNKYAGSPPQDEPWRTVRDALEGVPHPESEHCIPDHIFKGGARSYPGHTGSEIDQPSKTIKAGTHGVPGGENMIRYQDGSVRYYTVHEAKLIQTFPDDFIISGSWSEAMRQIGNAVPVRLAEIVGRRMFDTLNAPQSAGKQFTVAPSKLSPCQNANFAD